VARRAPIAPVYPARSRLFHSIPARPLCSTLSGPTLSGPTLSGPTLSRLTLAVPRARAYRFTVQDCLPELTAAGYVVADRQSVLATKFTGRLAKLNVAEAEFVKKGDVVAELDHSELDATIAQAEAEVAEAAAEVAASGQAGRPGRCRTRRRRRRPCRRWRREQAVRDPAGRRPAPPGTRRKTRGQFGRRRVRGRGPPHGSAGHGRQDRLDASSARFEAERQIAVVQAQAAAARAAVGSAEARQRSAAARVKVLESQREESFIRSPFDGMVTEKAAEVGEIVAPISIGGSMARGSIVTVADWASLQAEVDVAEAQLGRVKPGQRAAITVDAIPDKVFPGKVRRILPRADRSKATVKVRVDFLARDEQAVLPEMGVRVRFLPDNAPPGVETGAVRTRSSFPRRRPVGPDGSFVWVVSDGWRSKRPSKSGRIPASGSRSPAASTRAIRSWCAARNG
jgi:multidrug efflux pump subunit AcrA (membrane-fusion protein)